MSRFGMLFVGLIAATALIVACADDGLDDDTDGLFEPTPTTGAPADTPSPTPAATETPDSTAATQPPEGEIEIDGQTYVLGLGSFRWADSEQEAMGVVTPMEAVMASAGTDITIRFFEGGLLGDADVDITAARLFSVESGQALEGGVDWEAWERPFDAMGLDLGEDAERTVTLPDDLEPGTYVLEIEVESGDDDTATYGVLLEVR